MPKKTVAAMVEGGKASAGPPLGPALGPLGVKIPEVIAQINMKTKELAGMQVPIKVFVNEDKSFSVEVGTPPVASLIKKELKLEKASKEPGKLRAGDLSKEQVVRIAKMKFGSDAPALLSQVEGTARSMGITVGKGAVTEAELKAYEQAKAAEAAAEAEKLAAKEAATAAAPAKEGEAKAPAAVKAAEKGEKSPEKAAAGKAPAKGEKETKKK